MKIILDMIDRIELFAVINEQHDSIEYAVDIHITISRYFYLYTLKTGNDHLSPRHIKIVR